jgi:hypothetical protein
VALEEAHLRVRISRLKKKFMERISQLDHGI